ncbi:MAG: tetratricopeptide repeat protein [Planctomycetes bacterium]|nr:tetratricopeptide repeat protein [Planctomycetota bacterium]
MTWCEATPRSSASLPSTRPCDGRCRRRRLVRSARTAALLGVLCAGVGCSLVGPGAATQPAAGAASEQVDPFAPPSPPGGFDPQRANLALHAIPGEPPTPVVPDGAAAPELPRQAIRRMTEARRLFAEQRYTETIAEAEQALRYNARIAEAHRLIAVASLLSGRDAQARQYADSAIAIRPDDLACHYVRGRLAEKADQHETALSAYRSVLKCPTQDADPSYVTLTHYHLGLLLVKLGYYRAAVGELTAFETAAAALAGKEPDNPELSTILRVKRVAPLVALANASEALREYDKAAESLASALKLAADDAVLRVRHIKNRVRAKQFEAAAAAAVEHVSASKADPKAVELLLAVHRAAGHPDRGLGAIRQLLADSPDNGDLALLYADALVAAKQFPRAAEVLNNVAARNPEHATATRWKLVAIHRFSGDRRAWLWAIAGQFAASPAETVRALTELAKLPADAASQAIDEGLGKRPAPPGAAPTEESDPRVRAAHWFCLGWLAGRLNRVDDARTLFVRASQTHPDFVPATIGLAELYIERCRWQEAIAVATAGKTEDPTWQATLSRLLGQCHDGLDDVARAGQCYRQAIAKNAADVEAMILLARLFDRSNQPKEAVRAYEQALAANPEALEAREYLIMSLLNRWTDGENLRRLLAELTEMQNKAPDHPATVRVGALVRMLMRQPPDLANYARVLMSLVEARPNDHASRRALATALYRMGDHPGAERELATLFKDRPYDSEGNELLAIVLMKQLKIDEAARHLAHVLDWYPNREIFLRNLAETRLVQQDYPSAAGTWEKLLRLQGTKERHAGYRDRLIATWLQAGSYDKVRQSAEQWLADAKDAEMPALRSYLLAADAGESDCDRYLERCRKWLDDDVKDDRTREWLLGIGSLPGQAVGGLIGAGRLDEAVAQVTVWAVQAPNDESAQQSARQMLVQTLRAVRRPADIIEISRANLSAEDRLPRQLEPLQTLASAYLLARRYDDAIAAVKELGNKAAQINEPDLSFEVDELMISFLTQAKRYRDAITQANRIISELDDRETRLQQLADTSSDAAQRLRIAKQQEQVRQQRARTLRSLSFVYVKQEQREQAVECLQQALELAPTDAGINNDLGYTLADGGLDLEAAERMVRLAVSEVLWHGVGEDDRQAAYLDSLGWLEYKRGRFGEARRWLALAARVPEGDDPIINDHLGDAEWRLDHADAARQCWTRSLALHDRRVAEGRIEPDEKMVASVKAKHEALDRRGKPAVATSTAD